MRVKKENGFYMIEVDRHEAKVIYDALMFFAETLKVFTSPLSSCLYADTKNGKEVTNIKRMASALTKIIMG